jgi:hypothetical protein
MSNLMRTEFLTGYPLETFVMARREDYAFRKALYLYHSTRRSAFWSEVWAKLTKQTNRLIAIPEVSKVINRHDLGLQTVEIDKIKGSEGRNSDYDWAFRPLKSHNKDRWVRMATLVCLGAVLPPVELILVDDVYFVRDGHNRISAMYALGSKYVDAHVTHLEISFHLKIKPRPVWSPVTEFTVINL